MIKVNGVNIQQNRFPAGELLVKANFPGAELMTIEWYYEKDAELFTLICIKRYIDEKYPGCFCELRMPYLAHARMDRVKGDEDVFTLKYFCEIINSLNFTTVWVRDAHSNVSLALLNNVKEEPISGYITKAIIESGADALFFPDEGAMKRYSGGFQVPYAFGMKARDWETGKIVGYDIVHSNNIDGKNVLIVDDICSRGGTFYHAAKALKAAGAKSVSLYVTHCEHSIILGDLAASDGLVDHVYTTKSILPESLFWDSADPYWKEWITVLE